MEIRIFFSGSLKLVASRLLRKACAKFPGHLNSTHQLVQTKPRLKANYEFRVTRPRNPKVSTMAHTKQPGEAC